MARVPSRHDVSPGSILLVDDDLTFLTTFARELGRRGWRVHTAADIFTAAGVARARQPEVIVLDLLVGDHSGLELLDDFRLDVPAARVIVLTGSATVSTAVQALRRGAHDYLEKPTSVDAILASASSRRYEAPATAHASLWESERAHIDQVLRECSGNVSEAARRLRMHRRSLQRKLRKSGT
ncbi:MAG TPA: response regulator [Polyangia bacterium]|nr:response regulator [Polyangia bacterium]